MRKFKRRRRGTWFPNLGTANAEGQDIADDSAGVWASLIPEGNGATEVFITPLTFDHFVDEGAQSEGNAPRSLADFQGSEYLLQRIVGKLFLAFDQLGAAGTAQGVLVTAGFFVAREDEHAGTADPFPIGGLTNGDRVAQYALDNTGHITEPWIWRRQWILGNNALSSSGSSLGVTRFPPTNTFMGSVLDGPHLDAKTKRHVHREDRLWFQVAARYLNFNWADPFNVDVTTRNVLNMHLDYRLFGTLLKARNTGTF